MASETSESLVARLAARIIPHSPDFYALLDEQCEALVEGAESLVAYMRTGDEQHATRVRELEHAGDRLKSRNLDILHRTFSTPMDRDDVFRAVTAIDTVLNYAKSTVREMSILALPPDEHTLAMAVLLHEGTLSLRSGFAALEKDPDRAGLEADRARKTERRTEKVYRAALAQLFDAGHYASTLTEAHRADAASLGVLLEPLGPAQSAAVSTGVAFVLEILKRREIYRHMSNAADRVAMAGEVLHDIVVKAT
jgi:uncharacterized protein Yka (UPF0111/DUF47 family)